jgi:methionyl-tRNA synthetase
MSKSLGNVISPHYLIEKYGMNAVRFYFNYAGPAQNDVIFSEENLCELYNSMLANEYGNLVQRVMGLVYKNFQKTNNFSGQEIICSYIPFYEELNNQTLFSSLNKQTFENLDRYVDEFSFKKYIDLIWQSIKKSNQYIQEEKPWTLKNTDSKRMGTVLYVLLETIKRITIALQPIIPDGCSAILKRLHLENEMKFNKIEEMLIPGTIIIQDLNPVFPRIEK